MLSGMTLPFKKLIENKFVTDLIFALAPFETYPQDIRLKIENNLDFDWGAGLVKSTRVSAEVKLWNPCLGVSAALEKHFQEVRKLHVGEFGKFDDLLFADYEITAFYPLLPEDLRRKKRAMQRWVLGANERYRRWIEREKVHQRAVRRSIDYALGGNPLPSAIDNLSKYNFLYVEPSFVVEPADKAPLVEAGDKIPKLNFRSRFKSRIKNP